MNANADAAQSVGCSGRPVRRWRCTSCRCQNHPFAAAGRGGLAASTAPGAPFAPRTEAVFHVPSGEGLVCGV